MLVLSLAFLKKKLNPPLFTTTSFQRKSHPRTQVKPSYYHAYIISIPPKFPMNKTPKTLYVAHVSLLVDQMSA